MRLLNYYFFFLSGVRSVWCDDASTERLGNSSRSRSSTWPSLHPLPVCPSMVSHLALFIMILLRSLYYFMWFSIGIVIILCFIVCYKSKSVIVTNPIIMEISLKKWNSEIFSSPSRAWVALIRETRWLLRHWWWRSRDEIMSQSRNETYRKARLFKISNSVSTWPRVQWKWSLVMFIMRLYNEFYRINRRISSFFTQPRCINWNIVRNYHEDRHSGRCIHP